MGQNGNADLSAVEELLLLEQPARQTASRHGVLRDYLAHLWLSRQLSYVPWHHSTVHAFACKGNFLHAE